MHRSETTVEIDPTQRFEIANDVWENGGGSVTWHADNPTSITIGAKSNVFDAIMTKVRERIAGETPAPQEMQAQSFDGAPPLSEVVADQQAIENVEGVAQPAPNA